MDGVNGLGEKLAIGEVEANDVFAGITPPTEICPVLVISIVSVTLAVKTRPEYIGKMTSAESPAFTPR